MMFPGGFGGGGMRTPMQPAQPIQYPRPVSPLMPRQPIGGPMPVRPSPIGPAQPMPGRFDPAQPSPDVIRPDPARPPMGMFHKGGKVTKTGSYVLKRGEHVLPKGASKLTSKIRNAKPQKMVSVGALKA
jgi:hypothetical protein